MFLVGSKRENGKVWHSLVINQMVPNPIPVKKD